RHSRRLILGGSHRQPHARFDLVSCHLGHHDHGHVPAVAKRTHDHQKGKSPAERDVAIAQHLSQQATVVTMNDVVHPTGESLLPTVNHLTTLASLSFADMS